MGLVWIAGGIVLFSVGAGFFGYVWEWMRSAGSITLNSLRALSTMSNAAEVAGAACILKGRTYFVPRAEAALALDPRPPVLFLRSFQDEAPTDVSLGLLEMQLDRSLDMKLSKYFRRFGPFVAIGSPRDKLPKLGAIRLRRSDDEWRSEVIDLMQSSRWIIASVGTSRWIKWELAEIVARGHATKALFFFPVSAAKSRRGRLYRITHQQDRVRTFSSCLSDSVQLPLAKLATDMIILGCALRGGSIAVITCRKPTANASFFGVVIGHYLLMSANSSAISQATGTA